MNNNDWRHTIEEGFYGFSDRIYKYKYIIPIIILALVASLAMHLPKITFDTSTEGFLYKDDPRISSYNAFRNQFGRDEKILIAIERNDIFEPSFLKKLAALHNDIETNAPYIKTVDSLINARVTLGDADSLIVEDLFKEGVPKDPQQLEAIKQQALSNPIYKNLYLNEEATFTTLVITTQTYSSFNLSTENENDMLENGFDDSALTEEGFDENSEISSSQLPKFIDVEETNQLIAELEIILEKYKSEDMRIYIAGSPIVTKNLQSSIIKDMSTFIVYVIITIALLLLIMFKRLSGIILPLFIVVLTLLSTVGSMALFGAPINAMTQILPSLLLAVGVGASVHLLAIFYKQYDEVKDKKAALAYALGHSGLAICMTSLTTAGSLAAFSFSDIAPVARLGIFSSLGVCFQLILTLFFLPALIALLPIKPKQHSVLEKPALLDRLVHNLGVFSINWPKAIVGSASLIIIIALALASTMQYSHNPLHWFPKDHTVRTNTEIIDRELKGSITIEVVLDTKKENGVYEPEFLNSLEEASTEISTLKGEHYFIGKILSINDVLKEINKALNENQQSEYRIPQNKELIAQEFLIFENSGSDDLENIVDSKFSKTRLSIKAPWVDAVEYIELMDELDLILKRNFQNTATVSITGTLPILADTITKSIKSSINSYILAFILIAVLMILFLNSFKLGLVSLLPNLAPILSGVAFMVIFDMPLDMFTILIGAIAIGMVVDDTIHFMHNFNRYYSKTKNVDEAILLTINSTGRAIFITSIVLSSGFFVFMFASMTNLYNFGLITGFIVLAAMVADLILTAAVMKLIIKPEDFPDNESI